MKQKESNQNLSGFNPENIVDLYVRVSTSEQAEALPWALP